ncbi:Ig-like domain-containing protein [Pontiellaceae bacterium B12227]|nr:Ig-like domain-containing protein [Pontiellaceae bacterium B12227]
MKKTASIAVAVGLCVGTTVAATMELGYTTGVGSQLLVDNGGEGAVLFEDSAGTGGNDVNIASGSAAWLTAMIDGAGQWQLGDTVEITGVALQIQGYTDSGTMTFDVRQASGGTGASGAAGLASIGSATATYSKTNNATMYANFDTPISFVVDTNTFKIGINISNTARLRVKSQSTFPVQLYNYSNGNLGAKMKISVAGTVTPGSSPNEPPVFSENPFSKPLAIEDTPYNESLLDNASDPNNDPLTFELLSFAGPGPAWLGMDGLSSITGTPATANIGTNEWTVQVSDGQGGITNATMTIEVVSKLGTMIPGYTVGSGLLTQDGQTLFVDTANTGGTDATDTDGYADVFTVLIPGSGLWEVGDTVEISGFAVAVHAISVNGTMTFDVLQGAGGIGASGAGGLASLGTATGTYNNNGSTSTMYVNFETPVSFVADVNSTNIGINISNSGQLRLKVDPNFEVTRYNRINGNVNSAMKVSVAGTVTPPAEAMYDQWTTQYGVTNGPSEDHDNDGLSNLYEYGLNGNPTNGFVDADLPMFGQGVGGLEYVHTQRNDDTNLVYFLNLTGSLVNPTWTNLGYTVTGTNVMEEGVFDFVTNLIDTADSARFIQLEIEQTP